MSEDNVVQFPTTSANTAPTVPGPQLQGPGPVRPVAQRDLDQEAARGQQMILGIIDKNRKEGLEALKKRIENLANTEGIAEDSDVESRLRDLQHGLGGALSIIEALNNLTEYIKHDLIASIKNIEKGQVQQWQAAAHLQTLIQLLVDKGLISHEEMEGVWNKLVPSSIEEVRNAAKQDPVKQSE